MLHDILAATYRGGYSIEIIFDDGRSGIVDFSSYLKKGGVFSRFADIEFFKNFIVSKDLGTITWADSIDIAPESLYATATNTPLPHWQYDIETASEPQLVREDFENTQKVLDTDQKKGPHV